MILEAGALARTLLEAWELLIYFYQKPDRIEEAIEERLPPAGEIAKAIDDELHNDLDLKGLRNHYNKVSSHISFREEAYVPMNMGYNREMLKTDMRSLFALMLHIAMNAAYCLSVINQIDNKLRDKIRLLLQDGFRIFEIHE